MNVSELAKALETSPKETITLLNDRGFAEYHHHMQIVSPEHIEAVGGPEQKPEVENDGMVHFWSSVAERHKVVLSDGSISRFGKSRLLIDEESTEAAMLETQIPKGVFIVKKLPYKTEAERDGFRGYLYREIYPDGEFTSLGLRRVQGLLTEDEENSKTLTEAGQAYTDRLIGLIVRTRSIEGMEF